MKKLLSILVIAILSLSVYTNAAADNGKMDKGKKKKGRESNASLVQNIVEEEPIIALASDITAIDNKVTVKVFDITGKIVLEKKVQIENFFNNKSRLEILPKNSVFVMFHQNTAYYFQESEN
ncbi:hypothetical protein GXP67_27545 [Rhodocytophaga rosea]|uniref:T9SS type A sorting domain-containing protein n=1 Tax=Rhodocytophaga rosea TaxID=2704465 RepID=A0A6C0GQJ8_9BACT|nr:hypothetical protein [Rhodocytophaga rosea]QHT70134.1 hypothetical protein GXP67_27545 [Rhodocytophaga rosea]